jgi:hypothetical protein
MSTAQGGVLGLVAITAVLVSGLHRRGRGTFPHLRDQRCPSCSPALAVREERMCASSRAAVRPARGGRRVRPFDRGLTREKIDGDEHEERSEVGDDYHASTQWTS